MFSCCGGTARRKTILFKDSRRWSDINILFLINDVFPFLACEMSRARVKRQKIATKPFRDIHASRRRWFTACNRRVFLFSIVFFLAPPQHSIFESFSFAIKIIWRFSKTKCGVYIDWRLAFFALRENSPSRSSIFSASAIVSFLLMLFSSRRCAEKKSSKNITDRPAQIHLPT